MQMHYYTEPWKATAEFKEEQFVDPRVVTDVWVKAQCFTPQFHFTSRFCR